MTGQPVTEKLVPFKPEALDRLAHVITGNYRNEDEIIRLFERAGFSDVLDRDETDSQTIAKVLQAFQKGAKGNPYFVLQVIKTMCNPQGYIGQPERFERVRGQVNDVLGWYGLEVTETGEGRRMPERVTRLRPAKTPDEVAFDGRAFHTQVVEHSREHFRRGAYFPAVFECCKAFDAAVRKNTGIDKSGQALMSEALSLNGPLKVNSQSSQSEKDQQQGIMFLCMGLMSAVRNPQGHEPERDWPMTREDALDVLTLVSFLFRKLENSVVVRKDGEDNAKVVL